MLTTAHIVDSSSQEEIIFRPSKLERGFWSILLVWICLFAFYSYWIFFVHPESVNYRFFGENRPVFVQTDDFDYRSLEGLKNTGWIYYGPDFVEGNSISISAGELILANNGSGGWAFVRRNWEEPDVYDWKCEAMVKLVGEDSCNLQLLVKTENATGTNPIEYVFCLGASSYALIRNLPDGKVLSVTSGYLVVHDKWFTLGLERKGTVFKMYFNDNPINETMVADMGALREVGLSTGYNATTKFEKLTVEYEKGLFTSQNPSLYLVPDAAFLVACFALTYRAYNSPNKISRANGSSESGKYIIISIPIFLSGMGSSLLLMLKIGILPNIAVSILISGIVGFIMGLFGHTYTKRAERG